MTAMSGYPSSGRAKRGVALVIVLSLITLLSTMVIGLLIMAEQEARTIALQANALDARLAADSAVQIVEGQIRQATVSGIDAGGRGHHAWASQPGAVRVYDDAGRETGVYKLYSSDRMVEPDGTFLRNGADLPADWRDRIDEFVDLNE